MENIREIVRQLIFENLLSEASLEAILDDSHLQESGILDSVSTLSLVSSIEERFCISFMPEELGGDDFSTVMRIEQLVKQKITETS